MSRYSEDEYLKGIIEHNSPVIKEIYKDCFPMVRNLVMNNGGDLDQAKDIFQDTLIMIYRKSLAGQIKLVCKFSTYFYGISKKLWLQEIKEKKKMLYKHDHQPDILEDPDANSEYGNSVRKSLLRHFNDLSSDCRKILRMHFNKASIDEINAIMGYGSRHHTIDRKYRCKRSLVRRILSDPQFKNLKNEYSG